MWIEGHKCPFDGIQTVFGGYLGYTLSVAKRICRSACDARDDCYFADLYYQETYQTCYLRGRRCGDWQNNTHNAYHLYIKGRFDDLIVKKLLIFFIRLGVYIIFTILYFSTRV